MRIKDRKIPNSLVFLITVAAVISWIAFIGVLLMNLMLMFPHGL
jgi:hypothetical protein